MMQTTHNFISKKLAAVRMIFAGYFLFRNGRFKRFQDWLHEPVGALPLVIFRIAFGVLMIWDCLRMLDRDYMKMYDEQKILYWSPYESPLLHWLTPPPSKAAMILSLKLMGLSAVGIALGCFYRLSAFNNHYYLFSLVGFLMCFIDAHVYASGDALWLFPARLGTHCSCSVRQAVASREKSSSSSLSTMPSCNTASSAERSAHDERCAFYRRAKSSAACVVPRWHMLILEYQIAVCFFYGALNKCNADWLRGQPMCIWLHNKRDNEDLPFFLRIATQNAEIAGVLMSYAGLLLDLFIAPALYCRRTVWLGIAAISAFHICNHFLWSIGLFPFVMIGANVLWIPDEQYRAALHWIARKCCGKRTFASKSGHQVPLLHAVSALQRQARIETRGETASDKSDDDDVASATLIDSAGFGAENVSGGGARQRRTRGGSAVAGVQLNKDDEDEDEDECEATAGDVSQKQSSFGLFLKQSDCGVLCCPFGFPSRRTVTKLFLFFAAAQFLIPLRHWLYPGYVNWAPEGHYFSWRMMLNSYSSLARLQIHIPHEITATANATAAAATASDPLLLRFVNPYKLLSLTKRQRKRGVVDPGQLTDYLQYASSGAVPLRRLLTSEQLHVAQQWPSKVRVAPRFTLDWWRQYNDRPFQRWFSSFPADHAQVATRIDNRNHWLYAYYSVLQSAEGNLYRHIAPLLEFGGAQRALMFALERRVENERRDRSKRGVVFFAEPPRGTSYHIFKNDCLSKFKIFVLQGELSVTYRRPLPLKSDAFSDAAFVSLLEAVASSGNKSTHLGVASSVQRILSQQAIVQEEKGKENDIVSFGVGDVENRDFITISKSGYYEFKVTSKENALWY